ncbi:phosphorylated adapter RNA export protein isoform X3 [Protobothrops mucrosquamatus]|uniref:phosphorylated adapter RNA export protein isoform X3 n=1 Tax=Protobothrops mucrosquamatus TaxID=103944 RepID=UPI000775ABF1|nr:phosphorylated adapter RNA export protein isoform X3 [Protobothrops mucrosquamatus]
MASGVPRMEQDVEDGELLDSDSEMPVSAPSRSPQQNDSGNPAISFPSSSSQSTTSVPYRTVKGMDSTDESFSDSDEESGLWKRKRQKCSNHPPLKPEPFQFSPNPHKEIRKKVNNIWGEVLQKQNQDDMSKNLGILWMDGNLDRSRGSETYNYMLAKELVKSSETEAVKTLDKELEEYMQDDKKIVSKEEEEEVNGQGLWKRKRPIKEKFGQRQEMNYKGRYEITEDDPEEKVADEIAYRLHEPKKDLIARVVKIIGKKKSIELLMETTEVEQNGGLLIMDGSRRRTPGGVYINLLKNTPCITSEQIKVYSLPFTKFFMQTWDDSKPVCDALETRYEIPSITFAAC